MDMSRWDRGGKMSEAQKKQMEARMKPWLEKTYILTFNKEESIFKEDEKIVKSIKKKKNKLYLHRGSLGFIFSGYDFKLVNDLHPNHCFKVTFQVSDFKLKQMEFTVIKPFTFELPI